MIMWDANSQHFVVGDEILMLEIEDIYLLMELSYQGVFVVLSGKWRGREIVDTYIHEYCHPRAHKRKNKLPIEQVVDLQLHTILIHDHSGG